jgi:sugar (pentulose or hexulose) kinase
MNRCVPSTPLLTSWSERHSRTTAQLWEWIPKAERRSRTGRQDATRPSGQAAGLHRRRALRLASRVLDPSTFVRLVLVGVRVLAFPDIPRQVAKHGGEVMVAAAALGGRLP